MEQMTPEWKDFLHAWLQGATTTHQYSKLIVKTDRKLISDFRYQKLHNNNDNKPLKTGRDHVKYCIEISTFADKSLLLISENTKQCRYRIDISPIASYCHNRHILSPACMVTV